ncbi:MAG TPA: LytTR family DNA-binding domain-containing protein [Thermoanaerobaculia bacterium]|nr:LytTR family DNA-binding domain-containing protein [Thermoanaerobaculia bacterium]
MRKITCVVIDDEPLSRQLLERFAGDVEELDLIGTAADGPEAIDLILRRRPDVAFLDVQMPEASGFDVLDAIPAEARPVVVFITAYDAYALRAFDAQAIDYLLKPFDRERFQRAVQAALARIGVERRARYADKLERLLADRKSRRIVIRSEGRMLLVPASDIDWVEARGNYIRIHVGQAQHAIRSTLRDFTEKLPPSLFVRIHRSAIVNVTRIAEVRPWYTGEYVIVMTNGRELTLSKTFRDAFFETLSQQAS